MSIEQYQQAIDRALIKRQSIIKDQTVYRLFDGVIEGISGLYSDYYNGAILAHYLPKSSAEADKLADIEEALKIYLLKFPQASIYLRLHPLDSQKHKENGARLISGPKLEETIITEGSLKYYLDIPRSPHAGIYADMRAVREILSKRSSQKVLNLFAFTGSLGLASALGGAKEVLQIDSNPAALNWAKKNQELNKDILDQSQIKYFCNDSITFLKREAVLVQKGLPKADLIICDPPSFGRSATGSFSFKNNAAELAGLCLKVLAPQGQLIFTCNSRQHSSLMIAEIVENAAIRIKYNFNKIDTLEPPIIDFPAKGYDSIAMRGIWLK